MEDKYQPILGAMREEIDRVRSPEEENVFLYKKNLRSDHNLGEVKRKQINESVKLNVNLDDDDWNNKSKLWTVTCDFIQHSHNSFLG